MEASLPVVTTALLLEAMGARVPYGRDGDELEADAVLPARDRTLLRLWAQQGARKGGVRNCTVTAARLEVVSHL